MGYLVLGTIIGIIIGMYVVSQISDSIESNIRHKKLLKNLDKYDKNKVNPKMKLTKEELGLVGEAIKNEKETYPKFVKKHYELDKNKFVKDVTVKDITHYYTHIKKEKKNVN